MLTTNGWYLPEVVAYAQARMSERPYLGQIDEAMTQIKQARNIEDAAALPIKEIEKRRTTIADAARSILLLKIAELEADLELIDQVKVMVNETVANRRAHLEEVRESVRNTVSSLKLSKPDEERSVENSEPVQNARTSWEQARSNISAIHGSSNNQQDPVTIRRQIDELRKELSAYMKTLLGPLPQTLSIDEKVELGALYRKPKQLVRTGSGALLDVHTGKAPQIVFASPDEA